MKSSFIALLLAAGLANAAAPVQAQTTFSLGLRLGGNLSNRAGDDPTYSPNNGNSSGSTKLDYKRTGLLAPQFGAMLNVSFGRFALQPAVLFSQKGVDQTLTATNTIPDNYPFFSSYTLKENYHAISRPNYLEIPFNLVFTRGGDYGFQVFAGPYVAFGLGGRGEIEYEGYSTNNGALGNVTSNYYSFSNGLILYRDTYPGPQNTVGSTQATPFTASGGVAVARRFDAGLNAGVGYRRGPAQVQLGYGLGLVNQQPGKASPYRDELPAYYQRVIQLAATYFIKVGS